MTGARTLRICTLALALTLTLSAIGLFIYRPRSDFSMFYASGTLWRAGHTVYTAEQPNLNPPFAIVTLFAPLSFLSYDAARIVWIAFWCAAIAASIRIVARTLHWHLRRAAIALACALLTYPAWLVWFQGQMIWSLMYPATLACRRCARNAIFKRASGWRRCVEAAACIDGAGASMACVAERWNWKRCTDSGLRHVDGNARMEGGVALSRRCLLVGTAR